MAFAPNRMPAGVRDSKFAPYVLRASDVISAATPNGIRTRVEETYDDLKGKLETSARSTITEPQLLYCGVKSPKLVDVLRSCITE